jgi:hypothetical protein
MTDDERNDLAAAADELFNDVRARLDISDYIFETYEAEELIKQLNDYAQRCAAAGLDAEERMMLFTAEDVKKRTER